MLGNYGYKDEEKLHGAQEAQHCTRQSETMSECLEGGGTPVLPENSITYTIWSGNNNKKPVKGNNTEENDVLFCLWIYILLKYVE